MRQFIACLLLVALLGMIHPLLLAQQNQNPQKSDTEIEALKKRVSELEKQLQSVENLEKMELQVKLTEANAKRINMEVDKLKWELRDSNDDWLREWGALFVNVIGIFVAVSSTVIIVVGSIFWFWLRSTANKLIADTVEKDLKGFKEAVDAQDVIKNQLRILEKQYTVSMLENVIGHSLEDERYHPEQVKLLRKETILQILDDETYRLALRYKAAEVLASRKYPRLVAPLLEILNSVVDSDSIYFGTNQPGGRCKISCIHTYAGGLSRTQKISQPSINRKSKT